MKLDPADIRAFVRRDRARVQEAKALHWARTARATPNVSVTLSHALYEQLRALSPGYPSQRSRDEDLAHHLRLKGLIDRAARAFTVRRRSR